MNVARLIEAKRDGAILDRTAIRTLVDGYARLQVPDYQMSAFAMAVLFRGMTPEETVDLTQAMLDSGQRLSWPAGFPVVDKHSTGGVGDKISIPLAPILAELGMRVPMISGRGLGATGGTIDKLESIAGFRTRLSMEEIVKAVDSVGCVITGTTDEIAPADKRLYQLRDVTGTVKSIPLITASILSKKLAEGLDRLVLDVKWGSGAFMKTVAEARALAESLCRTASLLGVPSVAILTNMQRPLGRWIGNAVEIDESLEILAGDGPSDSTELTMELAVELLQMTGLEKNRETGLARVRQSISSGRAHERLERMVAVQGGDLSAHRPRHPAQDFCASREGFVDVTDCEQLGWALIEMRGGRKTKDDSLDLASGIEVLVQPGQKVERGEPLLRVLYDRPMEGPIREMLEKGMQIVDHAPVVEPLILERIDSGTTRTGSAASIHGQTAAR